ncbi:FHA domain-containing protein [Fibrisoma montanum]|uniref:FHA domain-containing protein n=1 Tax=Fibrisoma montanum TaxID=2305895 RepID=A0A418MFC4_9BACT|nr:FHA domain-containing protein [Fibrisoma montanum]RIV25447.1 FHA domain-containing protein [Fibrisoma montanum]
MNPPQVITIGRSTDNVLVVNQPSVSKYHAKVTFITDHVALLEDNDSTFGTNVDGRRIQQTIIGPDSRVLLGEVEVLDYRTILALRVSDAPITPPITPQAQKRDPLDFREDFKKLKEIQELYQEARKKIQTKDPLRQTYIRAAFSLVPFFGAAIGQIAAAHFINIPQKLAALDEEFKRNYVCPNQQCKKPFGTTPFIELANRKQCPTCKAKWAD